LRFRECTYLAAAEEGKDTAASEVGGKEGVVLSSDRGNEQRQSRKEA